MNSRATSRIAVAMITRAQMRPKPGSWRMASLATTPSDANISCTATSATCTEAGTGAPGERTDVRCSRLRDGIVVGIVGAAFDAVLLHQLAEVLAIDVGLTRGVRDVALVLLEQRQDVVALEGRHPALLGVLEGRLDVGGTDGDGRRRRRAGAARRLLLAAHRLGQIAHLVLEVAVGGGDDAHVDLDGLVGADAADLALLERAQELGLQIERQLAEL